MGYPAVPIVEPEMLAGLSASTSVLRGELGEIRTMVHALLSRQSAANGAPPAEPPLPEELRHYYTTLVQNFILECMRC